MTIAEDRTASYTLLAERCIRQQYARGDCFADIERYIERLPLEQDLKSALWMIAWADLPLHERRSIIMGAAAGRRDDSQALRAQAAQAARQSSMLVEQAKRIARKILS